MAELTSGRQHSAWLSWGFNAHSQQQSLEGLILVPLSEAVLQWVFSIFGFVCLGAPLLLGSKVLTTKAMVSSRVWHLHLCCRERPSFTAVLTTVATGAPLLFVFSLLSLALSPLVSPDICWFTNFTMIMFSSPPSLFPWPLTTRCGR